MSSLDLSVVLIGKTGNGKSATGNTLLGQEKFFAARRGSSVTDTCYAQSSTNHTGKYTVIDTPGLFDTSSLAKRAIDIQRAIKVCPQPHAFLLIMNAAVRVTPEELCTIEMLKMIFGRSVLNHMIVVFTHGGDFDSDKEFEQFWKDTPEYKKLVRDCGGRVCRIENKQPLSADTFHKNPIFKLVRDVSNNGTNPYNYDYSEQHEEAFQHHLDNYKGNMDANAQIQTMIDDIDRRITVENEKREEKARILRNQLRKQRKEAQQKELEAQQREADAIKREAEAAEREQIAHEQNIQMKERQLQMMEKLTEIERSAKRAERKHEEEMARLKEKKKYEKRQRQKVEEKLELERLERNFEEERSKAQRKRLDKQMKDNDQRLQREREEQQRKLKDLNEKIEKAEGEHKRELEELKKKIEESEGGCCIQ